MKPLAGQRLTIIGGGLAGALLATLLCQRGFAVDVYEKRHDPRRRGYGGGRSINLALAERGIAALRTAGLHREVLKQAVMMRGRMVHFEDGSTALQRYGRDDSEVIWSVHRGRLNLLLLEAAERAGARLHFCHELAEVDFDAMRASFRRPDQDGALEIVETTTLIGCDGAGSGLRRAMASVVDLGERFVPLQHGYKELEIPPAEDGGFQLEANALHIWPRGDYMCIALPNTEASFTVTLFLPDVGSPSFATVQTPADALALFERDFADVLPLMSELVSDFAANPVGELATLELDRWQLDERAILVGDAAHAMVPFHGQGMNCAFEDCVALAEEIEQASTLDAAYGQFARLRQPQARAIQTMAVENYLEMRDRVDDADFLLQRELERRLAALEPAHFMPRYAMVSFTTIPYTQALDRGATQRQILREATRACETIADVALDAARAAVRAQLPPLPHVEPA